MADILSQEEIDALLDVVEDDITSDINSLKLVSKLLTEKEVIGNVLTSHIVLDAEEVVEILHMLLLVTTNLEKTADFEKIIKEEGNSE